MNFLKLKLMVLVILVVSQLGCGYNPETPVYDTAANPDRFPKPALELIDNIENQSYASPDAIINGFVNLYTEHNELLDNKTWKEIIIKLGMKFRFRADLLIKGGVKNYTVAKETYSLAAFAKPNDRKIERVNKLFSNWKGDVADSIVSIDVQISQQPKFDLLRGQIKNLKEFLFADSSRFDFSKKYLFRQLFAGILKKPEINNHLKDSLIHSEKLFLSSIGLISIIPDSFYAYFQNPAINLAGYELTPFGKESFRIELYFIPLERIRDDYTVAFWVNYEEAVITKTESRSKYFPYDFSPVTRTSTWKKNKIEIANYNFDFSGNISEISVGLYLENNNNISYLPVSQTADSLKSMGNIIRLPVKLPAKLN